MSFSYFFTRPIHDLYGLQVFLIQNNFTEISHINKVENTNEIELVFTIELSEQQEVQLEELVMINYTNLALLNENETTSKISLLNSSNALLLADQQFEGVFENVGNYTSISIIINSDKESASQGLQIQFSSDGINADYTEYYTFNKKKVMIYSVYSKFFRIIYKNSTIDQTIFNIQTIYHVYLKTNKDIVIQEENPSGETPTNGFFRSHGFKVNVPENNNISSYFCWSYPISALLINYNVKQENIGDNFSSYVFPTTYISTISTSITDSTNIIQVNKIEGFFVGMKIFITDGYNTENLGIITSVDTPNLTITTQNPTSNTYHKNASSILHKFFLGVNTVIINPGDVDIYVNSGFFNYINRGFQIEIDDGTNSLMLKDILHIDKPNNRIVVSNASLYTFNPNSKLYIRINNLRDIQMDVVGKFALGNSKIGGSYVKKFFITQVDYNNINTTSKTFSWNVDYTY